MRACGITVSNPPTDRTGAYIAEFKRIRPEAVEAFPNQSPAFEGGDSVSGITASSSERIGGREYGEN
jgi:hypothetical protein